MDVHEGDHVQLICQTKYSGSPAVTFKWLKNDEEIGKESKQGILSIRTVTNKNHMEKYTCMVQSEALDEPLKISTKLNVLCNKETYYIFFNIYY
jgi:hypothetical protein